MLERMLATSLLALGLSTAAAAAATCRWANDGGFDQSRPELLKSDVKGRNPFQDVRVHRAFNMAVDAQAIQSRVMRNQGHPTGPANRQGQIERAPKIIHDEAAFIPLHQQNVVWAYRSNVELQQMADNYFPLRYVTMK